MAAELSWFTHVKFLVSRFKFEALKEFKRQWWEPEEKELHKPSDYKGSIVLGTGSFGKVLLVEEKATKELRAMKIMKKAEIVRQKQVQHTLNERKILDSLDFPFLVSLECSFKDNDNLYLVMSYVQGGELFNFLMHKGKLKERHVRFYTSQLVLALDYLHSLNVVYRDLKPENLLIGKDGYMMITDFGLSKRIKDRTWTIAGTPEYLAPEILLNRGYGLAVDWWALGVLIYELAAGFTPFFRKDKDVLKMYEMIIEGKVLYPSHFSDNIRDLLGHLIQKDLSKRFGNLKYGALQVRAHPWFKDVDWSNIFHKKEKPFFVPHLKHEGDTSYFEKQPNDEKIFKVDSIEKFVDEFADF